MLAIERMSDVHQLRQIAQLLDHENARLLARNQTLVQRIAELEGTDAAQVLLLELEKLQQQNAQLTKVVFGTSSERRPHEDEAAADTPPAKPQVGHGPRKQPNLSLTEVVHELPVEERTCTRCQGERVAVDGFFEDSEEVTVVRRHYEIVRHRRQKYACTCDEKALVTAPGPARIIDGGRYSVEFGVEVALDKYLNHLPLDRQRKMMHREGLEVTTQALYDQCAAVAEVLEPVHAALKQHVLAQPLIHADETGWKLIRSPEAERWQAWGIACLDAVCYQIEPSRSAEAGLKLLGGYEGVLMVDAYAAYKSMARGSPDMSLAHCWAHVRRKYDEIELKYPKECREVLDLIGKLYLIERSLPDLKGLEGAELARPLEVRLATRQAESAPVIREILAWIGTVRATKESALRKAVEYMTGHWEGLTRFLTDPRVPLDNNLLERSLRPIALGRKNHLGSKSERGIRVAAVLYSVIESAKLAGVEPRAYVLTAVRAALETPFRVVLPHEMKS